MKYKIIRESFKYQYASDPNHTEFVTGNGYRYYIENGKGKRLKTSYPFKEWAQDYLKKLKKKNKK